MINQLIAEGWVIKDQENEPGEITLVGPRGIKTITIEYEPKLEKPFIPQTCFDGLGVGLIVAGVIMIILLVIFSISIWW